MKKPVILSGIQSSGDLTIGNYIGSIKNWLELTEENECYFMIADLHTLTVRIEPEVLRENKKKVIALYLACGLTPDKCTIFVQSEVPAHSEINWILNCYTYVGELNRMTQFKDKSKKNPDNINSGLYTYPVLMASDILIYDPDLVPVGEDQMQHIEITRDIGRRFNNIYGETFNIPKDFIPKTGARIMGLQEPTKKMSKSNENPNDAIYLLDSDKEIEQKIKRAVTDSENEIRYDEKEKPGISNLLTIYSVFSDKTIKEIEKHFEGKNYGILKKELTEVVQNALRPIRERFNYYYNSPDEVKKIIEEGRIKANKIANKKRDEVYKKIGLI